MGDQLLVNGFGKTHRGAVFGTCQYNKPAFLRLIFITYSVAYPFYAYDKTRVNKKQNIQRRDGQYNGPYIAHPACMPVKAKAGQQGSGGIIYFTQYIAGKLVYHHFAVVEFKSVIIFRLV